MSSDSPALPPRPSEEDIVAAGDDDVTAPAPSATGAAASTSDAAATGATTSSMGGKPALAFASSITPMVSNVASNLQASATNAFASINKNLAKVRQFANETIGTADKTELSAEYLKLEAQFDRVKLTYENLSRIMTSYLLPGTMTDIKMSAATAVENFATSVQTSSDKPLLDRLRSVDLTKQPSAAQVLGSNLTKIGTQLGDEHALGVALTKCGDAQEKLGRSKIQNSVETYEKFVKPIEHVLDTSVRTAMTARRHVQNARLQLDTVKLRQRESRTPEKIQQLQDEVSQAQLELDAAVDEATRFMNVVVTNNDGLAALADFTQAQLAYFRNGFQLLEELAPEIDAMKVAQESSK